MQNTIFVKFFLIIFLVTVILSSCGNKDEKIDKNSSGTTIKDLGIIDSNDNTIEKNNTNNDSNQSLSEKFSSKLVGNIKCNTVLDDEGGIINQTVYISGNKIRMDYNGLNQGIIVEKHMISDGDYNYMWGTSGSFKMKIENNNINEDEKIDSGYIDTKEILDKIPTSKCQKWDLDNNMFKLPEGIEFMDIVELQKSMKVNIPKIPQ